MGDLDGKKLLVIGGAFPHCKVVEAAHKLGAIVYVVDYLENSPAKSIADKSYMIDVFAVDELVTLCKKEKIDGAIVISLEACLWPYQQLCEIMGYPCFGTKQQYRILTNKSLFKKTCKIYSVDTIPEYTESDINHDNNVEYPVFIKPVDSRGSRGQKICKNKKEACKAIEEAKKESGSGTVLVEKYMKDCLDFTVSYLVKRGEPILVRTADRFEGASGSGLENLCIASRSPSRFTDKYIDGANINVIQMLKGIGLRNAPVFFQGFIDGDKVRFYDPGLRFAGGEYERIQRIATGIDIIEYLVSFALTGEEIEFEVDNSIWNLNGKSLIQLDPTLAAGQICKIEGIEQLKSNKDIIAISQRYQEGDVVPGSNDLGRRFAEFAILSDTPDIEKRNIKSVQDTLKITDMSGNSMVVSPFNVEKLE